MYICVQEVLQPSLLRAVLSRPATSRWPPISAIESKGKESARPSRGV